MADTDEDMDPAWLTKLAGDLKELERTDPKVAEAKRKYDQAAKKVLSMPLPPALLSLDSDELALAVATVATPTALRGVLLDRPEVAELRAALADNPTIVSDIARWTVLRTRDFKQGERFPHEIAFCALVVALEAVPVPEAKKFIEDMAASQASELGLMPQVAQECLKARIEAKLDPPPVEMQLVSKGTCQCGVEYIVTRHDGKDSTRHKQPVCELFDKTGRVSLNRKEKRALEARRK